MAGYEVPRRQVLSIGDMPKWEKSEAYQEYTGFINALNEAVKGKKLSSPCKESETMVRLIQLLNTLDEWIDEIPPIDQPQRFGNKAFRTWYSKLSENAESIVGKVLPEEKKEAVAEICPYLVDGFGNSSRIDYGTGHEMSFIMFLYCLFKVGALVQEDKVATVTKAFQRYILIVRKLLMTYKLEPAGSHGVWSLDDYSFMPFIWGSSQLAGNPVIEPNDFPSAEVCNRLEPEWMFVDSIKFINSVKTGPFAEHSNQLWNISGVQSWSKVNQGLIKKYKAEVLSKFPVIQHTVFGSLLKIDAFQMPRPALPRMGKASGGTPHSDVFARPRPLCSSGGQGSIPIAVVKPMPVSTSPSKTPATAPNS